MFRFINRQVFKPTVIQYRHRRRVEVDHQYRRISTTMSGLSRARRRSPPTPEVATSVTSEPSDQLSKDVHCPGVAPAQPKTKEGKRGTKRQTADEEITAPGKDVGASILELKQAISDGNRKVDTKCRNLDRKINTNRKAAQEMDSTLYRFLGHLLFKDSPSFPVGCGKKGCPAHQNLSNAQDKP
ncbi:hypothetical protein HOY80DRAFT_1006497 [Tuber brumale]|nr:hypothetical protein HOY80DRAFT_1006497 [Tuber brumale]